MTAIGAISYNTTAGARGGNFQPRSFGIGANINSDVAKGSSAHRPTIDTFTNTNNDSEPILNLYTSTLPYSLQSNEAKPNINTVNNLRPTSENEVNVKPGMIEEPANSKPESGTTRTLPRDNSKKMAAYGTQKDGIDTKVNTTGAIAYGKQSQDGIKNVNTTGAIAFGGLTTRSYQSSYDVAATTASSYDSAVGSASSSGDSGSSGSSGGMVA